MGSLLKATPAAAAVIALVGAAGPVATASAARASVAGPTEVRYSFDRGGDPRVDGLRVISRGGGAVTSVPGAVGAGVQFPARCTGNCPRAILEGRDDDALDPGTRPIRYGASLLIRTEQTAHGSNVVQKGTWSTSSQWKLQVDGHAGRPGCAMAAGRRTYVVTAPVSVADGRWHRVTCVRSGAVLGIEVDGVRLAQVKVPAGLSVRNRAPLRIGGNGVSASSDHFHGAVDEVFVAVG